MKKILLITSIILLGYSCKKDDEDNNPEEFIFPLKIGNFWTYKINQNFINVRDINGNDFREFNQSYFQNELFVEITDTIIENDKTKFQVKSSINTQNGRVTVYTYPYNDQEGLKQVYSGHEGEYHWMQLFLTDSMDEYMKISNNKIKNLKSSSLINYEVTIIKYPLTIDAEWELTISNGHSKLEKRVVGQEIITINNKDYNCYVIEYLYKYANGENITSTKIYDYINSIGLVKRVTQKKNVTILDNLHNPVGYADFFEEIRELQDFEINE